jgi:hypothetical protein
MAAAGQRNVDATHCDMQSTLPIVTSVVLSVLLFVVLCLHYVRTRGVKVSRTWVHLVTAQAMSAGVLCLCLLFLLCACGACLLLPVAAADCRPEVPSSACHPAASHSAWWGDPWHPTKHEGAPQQRCLLCFSTQPCQGGPAYSCTSAPPHCCPSAVVCQPRPETWLVQAGAAATRVSRASSCVGWVRPAW